MFTYTLKYFIPNQHRQCEGFSNDDSECLLCLDNLSILSISIQENIKKGEFDNIVSKNPYALIEMG